MTDPDADPTRRHPQPGPPGTPAPAHPAGPPMPAYPYASWWYRVGAYLLDRIAVPLVGYVIAAVGAFVAFENAGTTTTTVHGDRFTGTTVTTTGIDGVGIAIMVAGVLLALALVVWNMVFRQGRTGQSVGKSWLDIAVVREVDGRPLGAGTAFVRWLLLVILGDLCFLNFLWPLWDARHRCWHDMLVSTVVIRTA